MRRILGPAVALAFPTYADAQVNGLPTASTPAVDRLLAAIEQTYRAKDAAPFVGHGRLSAGGREPPSQPSGDRGSRDFHPAAHAFQDGCGRAPRVHTSLWRVPHVHIHGLHSCATKASRGTEIREFQRGRGAAIRAPRSLPAAPLAPAGHPACKGSCPAGARRTTPARRRAEVHRRRAERVHAAGAPPPP